jgi:lipopolysaccharide biosynthesis protein
MVNPKVIAFHLPQFHRIPENDLWWGEGFTEWTNVKKARPLYRGHYQPRVPAQGRYYDLLDPEIQNWQAELARNHGVYGFCYYHYWFNGKRLLERPVESLLERGKPEFPFCLAWANEPWTRAWDGGDREILMAQTYGGPPEWRRHIEYLLSAFKDPRYIRVHGKPMLLIYRSSSIHQLQPMLNVWNEEARKAGIPGIHLVGMATQFGTDSRMHLFDAFADFEPLLTIIRYLRRTTRRNERLLSKLTRLSWRLFGRAGRTPVSYDYSTVWRAIEKRDIFPHHYPGAFVDWDNSPRRGVYNSLVMRNFSKEAFALGIEAQIRKARRAEVDFLFINAWNEWAEGTYLEPDEARGLFFLEAIRKALDSGETKA